jgi:hypothetical protein
MEKKWKKSGKMALKMEKKWKNRVSGGNPPYFY